MYARTYVLPAYRTGEPVNRCMCALIINIQLPRSKHTCVIMCLYFYTFASSKNLQVSPCESLCHNLAQSQKPPSHLRMSLKSAKVCEAAALSPAGLSPRVEKNTKLPMWRHELCHPLWQKPPVLPRRRHGQWSVMSSNVVPSKH